MNSKTLLPILLTLFFQSCRSHLKHEAQQCAPVFVYVDESQKLIDADASFCSVRQYEFSIKRVGPLSGTDSKRPLSYCDRCTGFKDYAETVTFWEKVRQEIAKDQVKKFQGEK